MGQRKQRGNGQGSVYQNGKKFRAQVTLSSGVRKSKTFNTKKEANTWIREMLYDDSKNGPLTREWNPDAYTVRSWFEKRLEDKLNGLDKRPIKEQVYYGYCTTLNKHLYKYIGDIELQDLTKNQLQAIYIKECQDMSQSTIDHFVRLVKNFLRDAVSEGLIPTNPHDGIEINFGKPTKEIEAYNREEQQQIIDYILNCQGFIDDIFYFLLSTGVRVGEACALTWDDIDFKNKTINIYKTTVQLRSGVAIQNNTKTHTGKRIIPINNTLKKWLQNHKKKLDEERNKKNLVFPSIKYNLLPRSTINRRWQEIQSIYLQIPYKNIHALRHTFATRCLEENISVNTVSKLLGHKNPSVTMDVYQSVLPDLKKAAVEKIEHLF